MAAVAGGRRSNIYRHLSTTASMRDPEAVVLKSIVTSELVVEDPFQSQDYAALTCAVIFFFPVGLPALCFFAKAHREALMGNKTAFNRNLVAAKLISRFGVVMATLVWLVLLLFFTFLTERHSQQS